MELENLLRLLMDGIEIPLINSKEVMPTRLCFLRQKLERYTYISINQIDMVKLALLIFSILIKLMRNLDYERLILISKKIVFYVYVRHFIELAECGFKR